MRLRLCMWLALPLVVIGSGSAFAVQTDVELVATAIGLVESDYVDPIPLDRLLSRALDSMERAAGPLDARKRQWFLEARRAIAAARNDARKSAAFAKLLANLGLASSRTRGAAPIAAVALRSIVDDLDPHSHFGSLADLSHPVVSSAGDVGLTLMRRGGDPFVENLAPDSPASRADIQPGDLVTEVDGWRTAGAEVGEVAARLTGPVGSEATLALARQGISGAVKVTLRREDIQTPPLRSALLGRVAYLRPQSFGETTVDALRNALEEMKSRSPGPLEGVVLDLRDNPGGLLSVAVDVASLFLPDKKPLFITKARTSEDDESYSSSGGDASEGAPLVVVVNGGSAAATEIVAAALQDDRRAILLGAPTFGFGTVQTVIPMAGDGFVRLTTARVFSPSGRTFQRDGVSPDIMVGPGTGSVATRPLSLRESDLSGCLPGKNEATAPPPTPEIAALAAQFAASPPDGDPLPDPKRPENDFQIRQALLVIDKLKVSESNR